MNGPNFELKGDIPGKNINAPKVDLKTGEVDLKGKVDIPNANANINGPNINADGKIPNINIKGKDETLIFQGIIPKMKGDVKIDGDIKKPELQNINPSLNLGIDTNLKDKQIDLNNKIKDININSPV